MIFPVARTETMHARVLRPVVHVLFALAMLAIAPRCRAEGGAPRLLVDWSALAHTAREQPRRDADPAESRARVVTTDHSPWFATPTILMSVVARNWEGAERLAGGPLSSSDAIRVSKSSRMLVGRVGIDVGRIVPFAQLGVGQWRSPDPHVVLPVIEYAAQAGAGVEVALFDGAALAVEYDWTMMVLEERRVEAVASRYLGWGEAFAVARWNFETTPSNRLH